MCIFQNHISNIKHQSFLLCFILPQDEGQLEVFSDLAMNSAGEMAMEIDRVSIFHRAASGYAAFIFGYGEDTDCNELMQIAKGVETALQVDPSLPKLLVRETRYGALVLIFWTKPLEN